MPTLDLNKIKIYDAGNTVADRYTIIFINRKTRGPLREALASSANPFHPQGFGQHIECAPLSPRQTPYPGRSTRAGAAICQRQFYLRRKTKWLA